LSNIGIFEEWNMGKQAQWYEKVEDKPPYQH
jgi:hypothetical protein